MAAVAVLGTAAAIAVPALASATPTPHRTYGTSSARSITSDKSHPKPTIASVQKKLARLTMKNAELVEQFNQARISVEHRTRAAAVAQTAATKAAAKYNAANAAFTQVVQAQYESGGFSGSSGALLTSSNTNSYLDTISSMDLVSTHEAQVVKAVQTTRRAATKTYSRARTLLTQARAERKSVATKKAAVHTQITSYNKQLAKLTAAQMKTFNQTVNTSLSPTRANGLASAATSPAAKRALRFAIDQIGKPYVFGSAGPSSYDCSGLTMEAWKRGGVSLPHSALQQYNYGTHVDRSQLQPGDLIFFYNPIGHVTIYAGDGMMVSAPETGENVSLVPLSHFNSDYAGATHLK